MVWICKIYRDYDYIEGAFVLVLVIRFNVLH